MYAPACMYVGSFTLFHHGFESALHMLTDRNTEISFPYLNKNKTKTKNMHYSDNKIIDRMQSSLGHLGKSFSLPESLLSVKGRQRFLIEGLPSRLNLSKKNRAYYSSLEKLICCKQIYLWKQLLALITPEVQQYLRKS